MITPPHQIFRTHRHYNKRGITLSLGGGAARGFAHVGAIYALKEAKIPFDMIIGISMGAIVGSVYSLVPDIDFTRDRLVDMLHSDGFKESLIGTWSATFGSRSRNILASLNRMLTQTNVIGKMFFSKGLLDLEGIDKVLFPYLPNISIKYTRIPFACAAVDLLSGDLKIFLGENNLRQAVLASASMPLVFPPRQIDGKEYVDGGVLDKIGIDTASKLRARFLIAVDVSDENLPEKKSTNALDVMLHTEEIASLYRRNKQLTRADVLIQPITGVHHWADYGAWQEFLDMGYEATRDKIEEIRSKLRIMSFKKYFTMFKRSRRY